MTIDLKKNLKEAGAIAASTFTELAAIGFGGLTYEVGYRACAAASRVLNINNQWIQSITKQIPSLAGKILRPFSQLSHREVAIALLSCLIMKEVSSHFVKFCFGQEYGGKGPLYHIKRLPSKLFAPDSSTTANTSTQSKPGLLSRLFKPSKK